MTGDGDTLLATSTQNSSVDKRNYWLIFINTGWFEERRAEPHWRVSIPATAHFLANCTAIPADVTQTPSSILLLARVHRTTSWHVSWTCQNTPGTSLCQFVQNRYTHIHTERQTDSRTYNTTFWHKYYFLPGRDYSDSSHWSFVCNIGRQISSPAKTETSLIKETWNNNTVNCGNCVLKLLSQFGHHFCCPSSYNTIFFLHGYYLTVCRFTQITEITSKLILSLIS
jgi:hypothetical protein